MSELRPQPLSTLQQGNSSLSGVPNQKTIRLSADAPGYVPPAVRGLFDAPLPTFVLPPAEAFDDGRVGGISLEQSSLITAAAAYPLLSQQLPVNASRWPSIDDGLSKSRELFDAVLRTTAYPIGSLTSDKYADHMIALLAAEVASSRAEIPSYDLHGAKIDAVTHAPGFSIASLYVPGAAENMPALDYGSVVRLRPSWMAESAPASIDTQDDELAPIHGNLIHPFIEIEARVMHVNLSSSIVDLRLPSVWHAKCCLRCAATVASPLPAECPPLTSRCGHAVLCTVHALETSMMGFACPLCILLHHSALRLDLNPPADAPSFSPVTWSHAVKQQPYSTASVQSVLQAVRWSARFEYRFSHVQSVVRALDYVVESIEKDPVRARLFPCVGDLPAIAFARGTLARQRLLQQQQPVSSTLRNVSPTVSVVTSDIYTSEEALLDVDVECSSDEEKCHDDVVVNAPPLTWVNKRLNLQQRGAVEAIVSGRQGRIPYLLVGPAGTGKTSTLVESVLQVLGLSGHKSTRSLSRVLIVSPSDEASDLVLLALHTALIGQAPSQSPPVSAASVSTAPLLGTTMGLCPVLGLPPYLELRPVESTQVHGVLRFNLPSRKSDSLQHPSLLQYCVTDMRQGTFVIPPASLLSRCRIIVATALGCAALRSALTTGSAECSFLRDLSHLFFDEASQCMEVESLVPLSLAGDNTAIIITGDPKQLGPVVRSPLAASRGLSVSLQERIMDPFQGPTRSAMLLPVEVAIRGKQTAKPASRDRGPRGFGPKAGLDVLLLDALQSSTASHPECSEIEVKVPSGYHLVRCVYADETLRERLSHPQALVTTLTANYRSHPALVMLPSLLFYGGSLESRAPDSLTGSCLSWSWLSRGPPAGTAPTAVPRSPGSPGFPLLCLGVKGSDNHLPDSPSFWNVEEVNAVVAAISSLLTEAYTARQLGSANPFADITAFDVGVISPYRQQVLRLRRALRVAGLGSVSVGSVANFQGSEKKAIFVSTVLSTNYGARACFGTGTSQDESLLLPRAIGLFGDRKRFNVAITRAQSILVCVGDPSVWVLDPLWKKLLQYAVDHDAYMSAPSMSVHCPLLPTNLGLGLSATVARETDAPVGGYVVNASVAAEQVATDHMEVVRQRLADVLNLRELEGAWRLMM